MSDKNNSAGGGLGLGTVLFLIFLVLKLCNVIDWSWWWVTSPLWISAIIIVLLFVGIFVYYYIEEKNFFRPKIKNGSKKNEKD